MSASQRGSSHNPLVARAIRLRQAEEADRRAKEARKEALREHGRQLDEQARQERIARKAQEDAERRAREAEARREHGRKLDQIESCYRQYTPAQQRRVHIDDLFEQGAIEWDGDVLVPGAS